MLRVNTRGATGVPRVGRELGPQLEREVRIAPVLRFFPTSVLEQKEVSSACAIFARTRSRNKYKFVLKLCTYFVRARKTPRMACATRVFTRTAEPVGGTFSSVAGGAMRAPKLICSAVLGTAANVKPDVRIHHGEIHGRASRVLVGVRREHLRFVFSDFGNHA